MAGKYTDDGRIDEKRTSQFPAFERAILQYANTCLDEWRDKAIDVAKQLVRSVRSQWLFSGDEKARDRCFALQWCCRASAMWQAPMATACDTQVKMEEDFVTAAFFRHAIAQRSDHMRQLEDLALIEDGKFPLPYWNEQAAVLQVHTCCCVYFGIRRRDEQSRLVQRAGPGKVWCVGECRGGHEGGR